MILKRLKDHPLISDRYGREARALVLARVQELDALDDERLARLIEEPSAQIAPGPSGETYDVKATGYAGKGIPEDEPDIYVVVEATRTGDRPPYLVEGEIGRFRAAGAKRHNWAGVTGNDSASGLGIAEVIGWAVLLVPWAAGVWFLVTRLV